MTKTNLKEFFKVSEVDISELINEPKLLSIQILHLYHYIYFWYVDNRYKKFKIFDKLIENKDIINSIKSLQDIPYELHAKYLSIIETYSIVNKYTDIYDILNKIKRIEENDLECRAIYIKSIDDKSYYILLKFYYHNIIILIDIQTMNIIKINNLEEGIKIVSNLCNSLFNYQLASIFYTPHHYRANYNNINS